MELISYQKVSECLSHSIDIKVVGDCDSSVMAAIRESVVYGVFVQKIDCANHACRAYIPVSFRRIG